MASSARVGSYRAVAIWGGWTRVGRRFPVSRSREASDSDTGERRVPSMHFTQRLVGLHGKRRLLYSPDGVRKLYNQ